MRVNARGGRAVLPNADGVAPGSAGSWPPKGHLQVGIVAHLAPSADNLPARLVNVLHVDVANDTRLTSNEQVGRGVTDDIPRHQPVQVRRDGRRPRGPRPAPGSGRFGCRGEGGSIFDAEVPDESDHVAIGIAGWRTASHLCLPSRSLLWPGPLQRYQRRGCPSPLQRSSTGTVGV